MSVAPLRFLPYGERALLVEFVDTDAVAGYAAALRAWCVPGIVDIVPAARTVLVVFDEAAIARAEMQPMLEAVKTLAVDAPTGAVVVIDVQYDGDDLAAVAEHCALEVADVIRRHGAATYRSAFFGFAPGFAYLTGLDPALVVPRLATPRPRVRAGAVAIAAEYCGVYPRDMPGGWHIVGHTHAPLWNLAREQPALLAPGTAVRFRALR